MTSVPNRSPQRKIIHVDMDSFYASVEARDRPELRGKPIAVGGSPEGRGVIAAASYEARRYGVKSAMASAKAYRLCRDLILIRPDFSKYKAESRKVRAILDDYTQLVEPLSLDEAYLDVTGSESATLIAKEIRQRIFETTGLTASAGVAPNKFLAKVASEWNKPNGLKVIRPEDVAAIMPTLKVDRIFGVGKVTARKLNEQGIFTCGDLQKLGMQKLLAMHGSWGAKLYLYAHGEDDRPVDTSSDRRSLTVEETYATDLASLSECRQKIPELFADWEQRFNKNSSDERIHGIVCKLKSFDFRTTTHERSFRGRPKISDFESLIESAHQRLNCPIRLIGIGVRLARDEKQSNQPQLGFDLD